MRCTCDDIHELNPLDPESEFCPVHDLDEEEDEWGGMYAGTTIVNESDLDAIYS